MKVLFCYKIPIQACPATLKIWLQKFKGTKFATCILNRMLWTFITSFFLIQENLLIKKGETFSTLFVWDSLDVKISSTPLSCLHWRAYTVAAYMLLRVLSTRSWGSILFMVTQWRNFSQNSVSGMIVIFINNFHEKASLFLLLMRGSSNSCPYFTTCTQLLGMHFA